MMKDIPNASFAENETLILTQEALDALADDAFERPIVVSCLHRLLHQECVRDLPLKPNIVLRTPKLANCPEVRVMGCLMVEVDTACLVKTFDRTIVTIIDPHAVVHSFGHSSVIALRGEIVGHEASLMVGQDLTTTTPDGLSPMEWTGLFDTKLRRTTVTVSVQDSLEDLANRILESQNWDVLKDPKELAPDNAKYWEAINRRVAEKRRLTQGEWC